MNRAYDSSEPLMRAFQQGLVNHQQLQSCLRWAQQSGQTPLQVAVQQGLLGVAQAQALNALSEPTIGPGAVVDDYEILELLGRGAMGAVYRARKNNAEYAIKTVLPENFSPEAFVRFEREALSLSQLSKHPHIVTIHHYCKRQRDAYLVLDYLPGPDLEKALGQGRYQDPMSVLELAQQLASGLTAIHDAGYLHRDLKAANVLLREHDQCPMISDFGLVTGQDFDKLTRTGEIVGTPATMAPEIFKGQGYTQMTDQWAFATLIYQALSGGPMPFPGNTPAAVSGAILNRAHTRLVSLRPELPAALDDCFDKAFAKDTNKRHASLSDFLFDFEDSLHDRRQRSPKTKLFASLALLLIVLGVSGAWLWSSHRRAQHRQETLKALTREQQELLSQAPRQLLEGLVSAELPASLQVFKKNQARDFEAQRQRFKDKLQRLSGEWPDSAQKQSLKDLAQRSMPLFLTDQSSSLRAGSARELQRALLGTKLDAKSKARRLQKALHNKGLQASFPEPWPLVFKVALYLQQCAIHDWSGAKRCWSTFERDLSLRWPDIHQALTLHSQLQNTIAAFHSDQPCARCATCKLDPPLFCRRPLDLLLAFQKQHSGHFQTLRAQLLAPANKPPWSSRDQELWSHRLALWWQLPELQDPRFDSLRGLLQALLEPLLETLKEAAKERLASREYEHGAPLLLFCDGLQRRFQPDAKVAPELRKLLPNFKRQGLAIHRETLNTIVASTWEFGFESRVSPPNSEASERNHRISMRLGMAVARLGLVPGPFQIHMIKQSLLREASMQKLLSKDSRDPMVIYWRAMAHQPTVRQGVVLVQADGSYRPNGRAEDSYQEPQVWMAVNRGLDSLLDSGCLPRELDIAATLTRCHSERALCLFSDNSDAEQSRRLCLKLMTRLHKRWGQPPQKLTKPSNYYWEWHNALIFGLKPEVIKTNGAKAIEALEAYLEAIDRQYRRDAFDNHLDAIARPADLRYYRLSATCHKAQLQRLLGQFPQAHASVWSMLKLANRKPDHLNGPLVQALKQIHSQWNNREQLREDLTKLRGFGSSSAHSREYRVVAPSLKSMEEKLRKLERRQKQN